MMVKVFVQKRGDALRVATAPGSCIVRFSFPEQINLFDECDASNEMKVINDVLASESISEGLEKVKNRELFIKSYSKILDSIRRANSDVRFTTASPNSVKVSKIELSKENVKSGYEYIKNISKVEKERLRIKGTLIALDVKNKSFKIQLEDGTIKSGSVINDLLEKETFEVPKAYEVLVDVERLYTDNGLNFKERYSLKELYA